MSNFSDMIQQVKRLKNGVGAQKILDEAYKILGNPILMNNTEYCLLAYTEVKTDDQFWTELVERGTFSLESQKIFEEEGFIEEVANNRIAFLKTPKLKYDRINGKLFNKTNTHVANLLLLACNKPLSEGDEIIFELICKLMTKEISLYDSFDEYEQAHHELLIKSLIEGTYDMRIDLAQTAILYDALETQLYVVVADINESGLTREKARTLLSKLHFKHAFYGNYIVFIVSTNEPHINVGRELANLINFFEEANIYGGISKRFENLEDFKKHYDEALFSLQCVLSVKCSQRIFPHHEKSLDTLEEIQEIQSGSDIQHFLNAGAKIFHNPLLFHDLELNLLGYTQNHEIVDPIWEEIIAYGTGSDETIRLFNDNGFVHTMESTRSGALLVDKNIKYDRMSMKVYSGDKIMIGCLSIVNTDTQFSEDLLVLFGIFTQKFSREVKKIEFYNIYGRNYSDTVINRLLSGKIDDYTFYTEDIGNLYDNLMRNLYLVVIDTSQAKSKSINLSYVREAFTLSHTVNRYAIYENRIIAIVSFEDPAFVSEDREKIKKAFKRDNIFAGVSRRFENIYDLPKYYHEALDALVTGMNSKKNDGQIWIFDCDTEEF